MMVPAVFVGEFGVVVFDGVDAHLDHRNAPLWPNEVQRGEQNYRHVSTWWTKAERQPVGLYVKKMGRATETFAIRIARPKLERNGVVENV